MSRHKLVDRIAELTGREHFRAAEIGPHAITIDGTRLEYPPLPTARNGRRCVTPTDWPTAGLLRLVEQLEA